MELFKIIMLAGIATLCCGQSAINLPPMLSDPTVRVVNATRTYRDAMNYQQIYNVENANGYTIYELTAGNRYARYNCHVRSANGSITNRVPSDYVFTVFLQMPVLHFLELRYKIRLMNAITRILNINDPDRSPDSTVFAMPPAICIDGYDQTFVGSFEEGIMLRIYQRPTGGTTLDGRTLRTRFESNEGGFQLSNLEGLPAIDYMARAAGIGPTTWLGRVSINLGGCRQLDPQYNYFNGRQLTPAELSCRSLDTDEQNDFRDDLAENPDPINFYLEAGDYVFAVLGSIAVAIVLGLAILGYFIHPFFLA